MADGGSRTMSSEEVSPEENAATPTPDKVAERLNFPGMLAPLETVADNIETRIEDSSPEPEKTLVNDTLDDHEAFDSGVSHSFRKHVGESLSWTGVNMVFKEKSGKCRNEGKGSEDRYILRDVWGEINPGETTALLGPSGAGKTSLFNILAGRAASKGRISIDTHVTLGGVVTDFSTIRKKIAFVAQEDSLHESSTPREAIRFSAKLRLPKTTSDEDIDNLVDAYIKELGLQSCADTIIGGGLKKGLSGGEKKRTSVGVELVVSPPIVLLDEPTSGLDSVSADQVCKVLNKMASAGTSVLFTIHQPSTEIFESFDKLILMNRGRVMYQGKITDCDAAFAEAGYPIPPHFNPADWILRVAQGTTDDELEEDGFYPADDRSPAGSKKETPAGVSLGWKRRGDKVSLGTEILMLFQRERRSVVRNPAPLIANLSITCFLALLYGLFFLNVGRLDRTNPTDTQAQLGAVVNVLISTMMGQAQVSLTSFPTERPLFLREYSTNHYSVFAYFISKLTTEVWQSALAIMLQSLLVYFLIGFQQAFGLFFAINFALALTSTAVAVLLGSAISDPSQAPQFFTLMVVPQFFFSGVFTPIDLVPEFLRWAQYLCSLRYASGLSMIYEFGDCDPGLEELNCNNILDRNNVNSDDAWWFWLALCGIFAFFRLAALGLLKKRATDFS